MTPGPITAAAARTKRAAAEPSEKRTGAKRRLRRLSGSRSPRRVSGPATHGKPTERTAPPPPAGGSSRSAGAAVAARAEPAARPASRPVVRPTIAPRPDDAPGRARPSAPQPIGVRVIASVRSLPDHALLDRLVRGRAWIPLLGLLLAGIVATQVAVLKMSASMGRSIAYTSQLQIRNEQLRTTIASLADAQRIERLAASMGMVMPHPEMVGFLSALPAGALQRATASIHAPDTTNFLYSQANYGSTGTNGLVVTQAGLQATLAVNTGSGGSASVSGLGVTAGVGTGVSSGGANAATPSQTTQAGAPAVGTTSPSGGGGGVAATGAPSGSQPASGGGGGTPSGPQGGQGGQAGQGSGTNTPATGGGTIQPAGAQTPGG